MSFTLLLGGVLGIGLLNSFLSTLFLEKFFQVQKTNPTMGQLYCIMATLLGIAGIVSAKASLYALFPKLGHGHATLLGFAIFIAVFLFTYKRYHGNKIPILR